MKISNQSIPLVVLQIIGTVVGFISTVYIARDLDPSHYALVGVYIIVSNLSTVFSSTGIETLGIRNILDWQNRGFFEEITSIVSIALLSRFIFALVIAVPVGFYSYYLACAKFDGNYMNLILLMPIAGVFRALNDSINLLLKAFNKYFISSLSAYTVNSFGKVIALIVFLEYGIYYYFIVVFLVPVFASTVSLFFLREYLSIKFIFHNQRFKNYFRKSKPFLVSSYVSYLHTNFDQLIVSIFLSAELLGSFSLVKTAWNIGKTFIENLFDPLCQKVVVFRYDIIKMMSVYSHAVKLQKVLVSISILIVPIFYFIGPVLIASLGLENYPNIHLFLMGVLIASILYVWIKPKLNFATLLLPENSYFNITLTYGITSAIMLVVLLLLKKEYLYFYLAGTFAIMRLYLNKLIPSEESLSKIVGNAN